MDMSLYLNVWIAHTEIVFLNASSQVCYPTADASPYAGPCSGKGDRGEGAGGGNQRAVLRRQVLCQNPSRSASQIYEIELEFFFLLYVPHNLLVCCSQPDEHSCFVFFQGFLSVVVALF